MHTVYFSRLVTAHLVIKEVFVIFSTHMCSWYSSIHRCVILSQGDNLLLGYLLIIADAAIKHNYNDLALSPLPPFLLLQSPTCTGSILDVAS